ncbi:MAG: arylsulfatase [Phycisphaeraceae bacterium]|nr:arylsulfatase [Phycisphaeraceae bacterium]
MRHGFWLGLCLLFTGAIAPAEAADKPNIIFIMLDDAGYGDLSCFGQSKFETPHIDRLAAEGMKLTDHYSGSTVCAPTRCVLMTGFHTGHAYIRGNKEVRPIGQHPIPKETVTVAERLKAAGYATGAFGKWGLGNPGSEGDPVHQGFDEFFGYNCQRNAHTYYPTWLFHNLKKVSLDGKTYSEDLILEKMLTFVRSNKDKPFFCYWPITVPHAAMHVPAKYHDPFRKKFPQFENKIGKYKGPKVRNPIAAFAGMMVKMDEGVGRLVALLKELNIDRNTLIVFTSDNGPHREGGHNPVFFDSNGPFRGFKRDLSEGGIRVPTIAWWPGRIQAGSVSDHPSAHWDFMPTACEVAGVKPPENIDGISYLPTLLGKDGDQKKHDYLYWEFHERGGKRAARWGSYKAIQLKMSKPKPGPIAVYDLSKDPQEKDNLADKRPELVEQARKIFAEAHTESEIWKFGFEKQKN